MGWISNIARGAAGGALVLALLAPDPARGQASENALAAATTKQVEAVLADSTPGVAVIVRGPDGTQRIAAGRGRLSPERALGTSATFRTGSLTKSFVAAAVLRQVERKRIRLTDTVDRWLPGLVPGGKKITVRQLLAHTSGLAEYAEDLTILAPLDVDPAHAFTLDALAKAAAKLPPVRAPGTGFHYASTNYVLLGRILEEATGRTWTRELRASVLRPLELDDTTTPGNARVKEPFVHGYVTGPETELIEATVLNPSFTGSAGMVTSTLDDVAAFYRALLGGVLIDRTSLKAMQRFTAKSTVGRLRYGLGLARLLTRCGPVWGHDGELLGTSVLAFSSAHGEKQVVAVFNRGLASPTETAARLALVEQAYCADLG